MEEKPFWLNLPNDGVTHRQGQSGEG